jgi:hypothetical protein
MVEEEYFMKKYTKWEMLKLTDKIKFFNLWHLLFLISNAVLVYVSFNNIISLTIQEYNTRNLGLSTMLSWMCLGYFLDFKEKYSYIYSTLKRSLKNQFYLTLIWLINFLGLGLLRK